MIVRMLSLAALLGLASCSSTRSDDPSAAHETPAGAIAVDTFTVRATVAGIDAATHKLTLVTPDGKKAVYKAGPDVINFNQIQVGDQVKATVTEEFAVFIRKPGTPVNASAAAAVALAPKGAMPGGIMTDTYEATAKITAVDAKDRKVTLQFLGGSKTLTVGKKVDLGELKVGDEVTVQVAEALALIVEKP
jgi:hypothetical protein